MKRSIGLVMLVLFCLSFLAGCAEAPTQAADGAAWSEDWVTLGAVMGVEPPEDVLTLRDNNTALSAVDMYYAFWTAGEPDTYTNADGDEVDLYAARLDLLVCGCDDAEAAQETVAEWQARQEQTYTMDESRPENHQGQEYMVASYTCGSPTNPYSRGITASTIFGSYAVSIELNCQADFTGDEQAILFDFLEGCHYNAALAE